MPSCFRDPECLRAATLSFCPVETAKRERISGVREERGGGFGERRGIFRGILTTLLAILPHWAQRSAPAFSPLYTPTPFIGALSSTRRGIGRGSSQSP